MQKHIEELSLGAVAEATSATEKKRIFVVADVGVVCVGKNLPFRPCRVVCLRCLVSGEPLH